MFSSLLLFIIFNAFFSCGRTMSVKNTDVTLDKLPPVIIVPGLGGSRLEAKLDKPKTVSWKCTRKTEDFYTLWLNVAELVVPFAQNCFADNIKLNYDSSSKRTINQDGVEIRTPGFGNTSVLEYLDPKERPWLGAYMNKIVKSLVNLGYERGLNIHGAPYDFRKGPSELDDFFGNLTNLVETTYELNNKAKVVFVTHSLGGVLTLQFFRRKPQSWKDKYIRAFISLGGAFGGSIKCLKIFLAGDDLGIYFLDPIVMKEVSKTMPSYAYLLPNKRLWKDEVVVSTPKMNYTMNNIKELFLDANEPMIYEMFLNEERHRKELGPPGVEVHCLYGHEVSTIQRLVYVNNKFPDNPMYQYGNGDGSVNLPSLEVCKEWITDQKMKVYTKPIRGINHMGIIEDPIAIEYILQKVKEWSGAF